MAAVNAKWWLLVGRLATELDELRDAQPAEWT
jgi:hypothetical protein